MTAQHDGTGNGLPAARLREAAGPPGDWTDPGADEAAPGVWRIPLPLPRDGLRAVNVYAITDGSGLVLVDGGWALAESQEELARALDRIGYGLGDISQFLVTHLHRDHYTQAVAIRRQFGARVAVGIGERPWLRRLQNQAATDSWSNQLRQLSRAGAAELCLVLGSRPADPPSPDWEDPDSWLAAATVSLAGRQLEVIPTPGHTRGHVVFRDQAAGLLFAGDHVLPHITPSIGFEGVPSRSPLSDYLASLALIRSMPDTLLLPAHGPVTASARDRIGELIRHHERRFQVIADAVGDEGSTAFEVAGRLTWTRHQRRLAELDVFNQMMAIIETAAHLDVLTDQGELKSAPGAVTRYFPR
jgi:glyoxylase-like metal-dependent hydrolase (beta-lactamase superfamily II)